MERRSARFGRPRAVATVATLVGVVALVTPFARPASADPLSSDRTQAAALAQKIDQENQQVEDLSNQYDAAQLHLQQVQHQVAVAKGSLASDQQLLATVRQNLTQEAVNAYTAGGFTQSPTGSPSANLDPLVANSYFEAATGNQTDTEDKYRLDERTVITQQQVLSQTQSQASQAVSTLASRRSAAQAAQAQASSTLNGLNGQIAQLVAQQQQAAAAQLAARQKAAYQAQLAQQQQAAAEATASNASGLSSGSGTSGGQTTSGEDPTTPQAGTPTTVPFKPVPGLSGAAAIAVSVAMAQVGKPYVFGGAGPDSFDCSGLVTYAYAAAGISLDHYTGAQWSETTQIPQASAQAGDLVFFNGLGHVGIYLGGGMMVDAPHTGADVRVESIYGFGSIDGFTRVG